MWLSRYLCYLATFGFVITEKPSTTYEILIKETEDEFIKNFVIKYPKNEPNIRHQPLLEKSFPCNHILKYGLNKSIHKPTSVHKLRPGDIDVIGAMGDSLIAGSGALEDWALGNIIEHRGISWCAGGQGTWKTYLTLPNILKEFNPSLKGYSKGVGEFFTNNSQLNVAYPVAADGDALTQAKTLVGRIKKLKDLNVKTDWKMITVFFGANDLCSAQCFNKAKSSPRAHATKLMLALDYLQENLPRTFVNLIPVIDVSISIRMKRSLMCWLMHFLYCTCFHQGGDQLSNITEMVRQYQISEEALVNSGRYNKKEDFTVVLQPFMKVYNAPLDPTRLYSKTVDSSYITHDCFHFSQKGHALGANMLWNNLLEPVGYKSIKSLNYIMESFKCPTITAPYLFTYKNSRNFLTTGFQ